MRLAAGAIFTPGGLFEENGDKIGAKFAPKFISSTSARRPGVADLRRRPAAARTGAKPRSTRRRPTTSGLRSATGSASPARRRAKSYRLVGLTQLGNASFGGASIAQVTLPEAQRITDKVGEFDQISVAAARGRLADRAAGGGSQRVMPPSVRVETAQENADRSPKKSATTSASCPPSCSSSASSPSSSAPS